MRWWSGGDGVAFTKGDGTRYAEAHHVQPVSLLKKGSLGERNIMVLCPNHHRQAHYGVFAVTREGETDWDISLDGQSFNLLRTILL